MNPPTAALAAGTAVTLGTAALIASTASYNLGAGILVGTAAGASVALVPGETGFRKIAGFLTGMVVAAGAYVLRAGALPDSALGAGIGIAAAFALITVISVGGGTGLTEMKSSQVVPVGKPLSGKVKP